MYCTSKVGLLRLLESDATTGAVHQLGGLLLAPTNLPLFDVRFWSLQGFKSLFDARSVVLMHGVPSSSVPVTPILALSAGQSVNI